MKKILMNKKISFLFFIRMLEFVFYQSLKSSKKTMKKSP